MSIEVKGLSKFYAAQKAVDNISFSVGKGEIVGFLGPNGAGKSTTMKMITGFLAPDGGAATVCGIDVKVDPIATKNKIGYLPEANPLYYEMYIREYLDFVADVHQVKNKKQKIEEVILRVGLTPENHKKIGQLSKGYKQRVGLAAALIHDPEVLILDEPTTGLDPNQIMEIRSVIKELGKDKTVLFSSHILQEVEAVCDRVVIISKGKLVADDKLSVLRSKTGESNVVRVSFSERVEQKLLERIPSVRSVNSTAGGEWELHTSNVNDVKRLILELALQNNLNILSLQSSEQSLEQIFRDLTN
ncbi:MAG: gliding motility-associated ABC transporter ATP-binding subunit GldA [Gemmatimonadaceae bacterium]|nr:gliding motility-associated ABC transporter ATP-binding subunit GldA [Chitinophagaceae bacterium]